MNKIIFIMILGFSNLIIAQSLYQTIRGKVVDVESKVELVGANIYLLTGRSNLGASSDVNGLFRIENVPIGRHSLKISYLGYEDVVISELLVGSAKEIILNIELNESVIEMEDVVVATSEKGAPSNDMAVVSARSFTVEETKRYPASLNDPSRMAQVFAGVSIGEDKSNEIIIRGNSPNGLLWRLEGAEIPPPNHFFEEGVSSGYVSMMSANLLTKSDFLTGAFPAEYGNALSGVFDLSLRNGNNIKNEYTFQFGALGTDLAIEGPFKSGYSGSYLVNYRYSTLALLDKAGINVAGDIIPEYQDLSFKLYLPASNLGILSLWGIGGISNANKSAVPDSTEWEEEDDNEFDTSEMKMSALGINHFLSTSKKSYLITSLSYSYSQSLDGSVFYNDQYEKIRDDYENLQNSVWNFSALFNYKVNSKFSYRAGVSAKYKIYDYDKVYYLRDGINVNEHGNTMFYQAHLYTKFKLTKFLLISAGLHSLYFHLNQKAAIEPRFGIKWNFLPTQSLSFGAGIHSKHEHLTTYLSRVPNDEEKIDQYNKNLEFTKAVHFILSYENFIRSDLRFKSEIYYQYLYDIPLSKKEPNIIAPINNEYPGSVLVNEGVGRNIGIEFTFEKFFSDNYFFLITSSIYDSKIKAIDGQWYNSRYNGNFAANIIGGKEFIVGNSRNNLVGISLKFIWAGGKRGVPYENGSLNELDPYGAQYSDYLRLDLNINYQLNTSTVRHVFSIDIQNATNRKNIYRKKYKNSNGQVIEDIEYQAGLIPSFNYRIEF